MSIEDMIIRNLNQFSDKVWKLHGMINYLTFDDYILDTKDTIFDPIRPLTSMKVILILNLHQWFFWPNLAATAHIWPLMTLDLHEGYHHQKLASGILLTKFGNHSA